MPEVGLSTRIAEQVRGRESQPDEDKRGGGSDDIGDISWTVPTVSLSFPANFQAGPGHNWANAIPMATPIAHKGTVAGARVQAMTLLDLLMRPDVVAQAREYFDKVQTKERKYTPLLRPQDQPAIHLNKGDHGPLSPRDAEVLLRPDEVQDLSRSAGDQVPDGARDHDKYRTVTRPGLRPCRRQLELCRILAAIARHGLKSGRAGGRTTIGSACPGQRIPLHQALRSR